MQITRVGVDLANNVFQVRGVDRRGQCVYKRQLKRSSSRLHRKLTDGEQVEPAPANPVNV